MTRGGLPRVALFPLTVFAGFALGVIALVVLAPAAGFERLVVVSGSMAPAMSVGDVVVLRGPTTPARPVRPGTIVTFRDPTLVSGLVTHRVVAVLPDGRYRTKGDANRLPDSTSIAADDVVGEVVAVVPRVGGPVLWVRADPRRGIGVAAAGFAVIGIVGWWSQRDPRFAERLPGARPAPGHRVVAVPPPPGDEFSRRPW